MAKGSYITRATDRTYSFGASPQDFTFTWDNEQKFGSGKFDYHVPGATALILPDDRNAQRYEIFTYVEATPNLNSNEDSYVGVASGTKAAWWGIIQDIGRHSRGWRSGLLDYDVGDSYEVRIRHFGNDAQPFRAARCHIGVLVDPVPITVASATGSVALPTSSAVMVVPEEYDPDGVYNAANGEYTAPDGAEVAVVCVNTRETGGSTSGSDGYVELRLNNTVVREYMHPTVNRVLSPGTFGMIPVTPGDTLSISCYRGAGGTLNISTSVEFY